MSGLQPRACLGEEGQDLVLGTPHLPATMLHFPHVPVNLKREQLARLDSPTHLEPHLPHRPLCFGSGHPGSGACSLAIV